MLSRLSASPVHPQRVPLYPAQGRDRRVCPGIPVQVTGFATGFTDLQEGASHQLPLVQQQSLPGRHLHVPRTRTLAAKHRLLLQEAYSGRLVPLVASKSYRTCSTICLSVQCLGKLSQLPSHQ